MSVTNATSEELLEAIRTAVNISRGVAPTPDMVRVMVEFIVHSGPVLVDLLDHYTKDGCLPGSLCTEIVKWQAATAGRGGAPVDRERPER